MKKLLLSAAFIAASFTSIAQVGIGTTTPDAAAALEISSGTATDKLGLRLPRVNSTEREAMAHVEGMQVYDTSLKATFCNDGSAWSKCSGTVAAGKFVDGTDNAEAVYAGNVGIGTTDPTAKLQINATSLGENLLEMVSSTDRTVSFKTPSAAGDNEAFSLNTNSALDFQIDGNSKLYIRSNGYIGINNNNPPAALAINGNLSFGERAAEKTSHIGYNLNGSFGAGINTGSLAFINTGFEQSYLFRTRKEDGYGHDALSIEANGSVGIGNTAPAATLDVTGYIKVGSTDTVFDANATVPRFGTLRYNETSDKFQGYIKDITPSTAGDQNGWIDLHD